MKKFLVLVLSVLIASITLVGGCTSARDGRDGKDGQDVSIYDVYEAAKAEEGNEDLTFDDFLKQYLNYTDGDFNLQKVVNRSLMSSVSILSRFTYSGGGYLPIRSHKVFTGSGVILWLDRDAGDAYVVTNCHVVYDDTALDVFCDDVRLYLYGQDEGGVNFTIDANANISNDENYCMHAEILGASLTYDIALLKVTDSAVIKRIDDDVVAATFAGNDDVYCGEEIYIVGNAEGDGISVANGIISKDSGYIQLSISEADEDDLIEYRVMRITAPINHGNSGGGLFNSNGEIIGIVNAKDGGDDIDNMGYALPESNVRRLLKLMYDNYVKDGGMKDGGGVNKAFLNISTTVSDSYATLENGVAVIHETVRVDSVSGAPSRGNLRVGDVLRSIKITSGNGEVKEDLTVTRRYHVQDALFSVRMGDTVTLSVERAGEDEPIDVEMKFDSNNYFRNFA